MLDLIRAATRKYGYVIAGLATFLAHPAPIMLLASVPSTHAGPGIPTSCYAVTMLLHIKRLFFAIPIDHAEIDEGKTSLSYAMAKFVARAFLNSCGGPWLKC